MSTRKPEITELIDKRDWSRLRRLVTRWPVADVAELLLELDKPDRMIMYRSLPRLLAAEVFAYMDSHEQEEFLRDLTDEQARNVVENLAPDDRTALLEELPAEVVQKLLSLLDGEDLKEARQLLGYPERSIGRLMTRTTSPSGPTGPSRGLWRRSGRKEETARPSTSYTSPTRPPGLWVR